MKQPLAPLNVIARAPFQVYFEGEAQVVSAANRIGPFDVLPNHADFFSILTPGKVIIETIGKDGAADKPDAEPISFDITNGIITVRDNQVLLFVNM